MSVFGIVETIPQDAIFHLNTLFSEDKHPQKLNLGVGAYKTEELKPYVLKSVAEAEAILLQKKIDKEYLPIQGIKNFCEKALDLIVGQDLASQNQSFFVSTQTVGGTGGLRLFSELLKNLGWKKIHVSNPTWANHKAIFEASGLEVLEYPYYDYKEHKVLFNEMIDYFSHLPPKSAVVLHSCCHNPTGRDLSESQWLQLIDLMKKRLLLPCMDTAYQGFGDGIEEDAFSVRSIIKQHLECIIIQSFSKNFGLYGERVGVLHLFFSDSDLKEALSSQMKRLVRVCYSNPPSQGARIVETILSHRELTSLWKEELETMRSRVSKMRRLLLEALEKKKLSKDFHFMKDQKGMFSFSGLDKTSVLALRDRYGIYMPESGRINIAGLCESKIPYTVDAIEDVLKIQK